MDGTNKIRKTGRLKINLGLIIKRTPAMMNPKSEISPPIPALHHPMISPVNAIRRKTTAAIPRMSCGLETVLELL